MKLITTCVLVILAEVVPRCLVHYSGHDWIVDVSHDSFMTQVGSQRMKESSHTKKRHRCDASCLGAQRLQVFQGALQKPHRHGPAFKPGNFCFMCPAKELLLQLPFSEKQTVKVKLILVHRLNTEVCLLIFDGICKETYIRDQGINNDIYVSPFAI